MNELTIAIVSGLIAMIGWGIPEIFAKKAIDIVGHYRSLIYTNVFLVVFTLPLLLLDHSLPELNIYSILFIILFGLVDFIGYILLYKSYNVGKVSVLNPITSTYAVLSAVFSFFVFGEAFPAIKILAFLIVMLGVVMAAVKLSDFRGERTEGLAKGVPYAILVFLIYGAYIPLWDKFIEGDGWVVLSLLARVATLTSVTLFTLLVKRQDIKVVHKGVMWWLLLNGLFVGVGNSAFNWGLNASNETSVTAAISSAYPLPLVIAAYFLLKERLELNQYIGIGLIVIGIVLMSFI